ncbi:hypothetical protein D3C75_965590 [compost metagenome]
MQQVLLELLRFEGRQGLLLLLPVENALEVFLVLRLVLHHRHVPSFAGRRGGQGLQSLNIAVIALAQLLLGR